MENRLTHAQWVAPICLLLLLTGCETVKNVKLWPFDQEKSGGQAVAPPNSTEYLCSGGKHFYVRYIDNGNAAWLIYAEREISLSKVASTSGTRYSNGIAVLNVNGNTATLDDGPAISFTDCKTAGK